MPLQVALLNTMMRSRCALTKILKSAGNCNIHTCLVNLLPRTVPFLLSDIGEGIVDVTVKEWYVKEGDKVAQFDPVCEVQSDKASVTITSRFDGHVGRLHYTIDQVAKVGSPLLDIIVPDDGQTEDIGSKEVAETPQPLMENNALHDLGFQKALATPAVRRIARENQVDLRTVKATGKAGRILKEDILSHLGMIPPLTVPVPVPEPIMSGISRIEEITGVKKAMVKAMTKAWEIPHFTYAEEVDVTALVSLKPAILRLEKENGVKITYLPFILKAISQSLLRFPRLNSVVDDNCTSQTVHSFHNLGVATDSPIGLIVPNIKNVQNLSVVEIAQELKRLQTLAKEGRLGSGDLSDGTFTVSNIGSIGGTIATPIILAPQVGIVALGKIQKLPRYDTNGAVYPADILHLSCSADHRVIDGAYVARFVNLFKLFISSPKLLLQL